MSQICLYRRSWKTPYTAVGIGFILMTSSRVFCNTAVSICMCSENLQIFGLLKIDLLIAICISFFRVGNSLIAHLLIHSNCSGQMSKCERFAQVAQDKWVTVSKFLKSLMTNEWILAICSWQMSKCKQFAQGDKQNRANHLVFWANYRTNFFLLLKKTSDSLKKMWIKSYFWMIFTVFWKFLKKAKDLLIPSERCKQIPQVAHHKWVNRSCFWVNHFLAHVLATKGWIVF